jgi:hypothetical protein
MSGFMMVCCAPTSRWACGHRGGCFVNEISPGDRLFDLVTELLSEGVDAHEIEDVTEEAIRQYRFANESLEQS